MDSKMQRLPEESDEELEEVCRYAFIGRTIVILWL